MNPHVLVMVVHVCCAPVALHLLYLSSSLSPSSLLIHCFFSPFPESRVGFSPANSFSHHAWLKPGKTIYIKVLCDQGYHICIGHLTPTTVRGIVHIWHIYIIWVWLKL